MELEGKVAPPMANGEVVFEYPWQSRVFGLAYALSEAGHYSWDEFREHLITQIGQWQGEDYQYFDCFLAALTTLLADRGLCEPGQLEDLVQAYEKRPHGHDH